MAEATKNDKQAETRLIPIAPGPHIGGTRSTRSVMIDVLIALTPAVAWGVYIFGVRAALLVGICTLSCVFFEAVWQILRKKPQTAWDCSAAVTGVILGLSIPWTVPWYVAVIGSGAAIIITKMFFGGLGTNIFNPAMAGRAFLQACFAGQMTTYLIGGVAPARVVEATTTATPLAAGKYEGFPYAIGDLALGTVNGSIGEVSAIACILGGLYLILRRTASWRIPVGMLAAAAVIAGIYQLLRDEVTLTVAHHMLGGGMLFGAAFIVTDPATTPLSKCGRWIFGVGVGALVMLIRLFANVPEGVMYAVLVMNITVPLIDRWTVPRPVGGPTPEPKAKQ
ncbi:hypothetical protein LCGC14_2495640 [marine sediment metagenome]|uniref:Ion-translocating oxidoreductase complex subunit D n=1 Tax=marine sediment metagenome TaxID=412755 RepID=A0A0F9B3D1_9ZZZZ